MTGSVSFAVEIYDAATNAAAGCLCRQAVPHAHGISRPASGPRTASVVGIENGADQLVAYLQ
jgi:hypothetical protein